MTPPQSSSNRCFEIDVDGIAVRVHGDPDMSPESETALTDLIRAAQKKLAAEPPRQPTATGQRILDHAKRLRRMTPPQSSSSSRQKVDWAWEWVFYEPLGKVLHHVSRVAHAPTDQDWRISGESTCGLYLIPTGMPGVMSRIGAPRCKRCCRKLGLPEGFGNPHNETEGASAP